MEFATIPAKDLRHTRVAQEWIEEGRQEGRQEGEQREQRTLLSVASRMVSETELERLGALKLERLREEVEGRIAQLAGPQPQG